MKVFLPFRKNSNSFIDEIEYHFEGSFIYGGLKDYSENYQIVNIHWPEAIFNWKNPTDPELEFLEECFKTWKSKSKIVYTCHNTLPHSHKITNGLKLYYLVLKYSDGFIHLGDYGKKQLIKKYNFIKNKTHTIIPHPLYLRYKKNINISEAKEKLGIDKNSKVILVFGKIRSKKELKLICKAFSKVNLNNKILLISRMPYFLDWTPSWKVKLLLKRLIRMYYLLSKKYKFFYEFVEEEKIPYFINASDVVFIPRIKHLNSGNVFLGFSYNKIVVGPNTGNITENLIDSKHYLFNPKDLKSVVDALEKGLNSSESYNYLEEYKLNLPINVAKHYSEFLTNLYLFDDSK